MKKLMPKILSIFVVAKFISIILNYNLILNQNYIKPGLEKKNRENVNFSINILEPIIIQNSITKKKEKVVKKEKANELNANTIRKITTNNSLSFIEVYGIFLSNDKKIVFLKDNKNIKNYYLEEKEIFLVNYRIATIYNNYIEVLNNKGELIILKLNNRLEKTDMNILDGNKNHNLRDREIKYSKIESYIKSPSELLSQISFNKKNNLYFVNRIKRNSFVYNLGIRKGDIFKYINGEEVTETLLLSLYRELSSLRNLNITIERNNIDKNLEFKILKD